MNNEDNISSDGRLSRVDVDPQKNTQLLLKLSNDPWFANHTRVLDLRWVPLDSVPIAGFSRLECLYLHENGLKALPVELQMLSNLRVLSLGKNMISSLPRSIVYLWMTLERLILGANQIVNLPFYEEEMMLSHGSIGSNPLQEPVGEAWMQRNDARNCIKQLHWLSRPQPGTPPSIAKQYQDLFLHNCLALDEPMVYQALFDGYTWDDDLGLLHEHHFHPIEREALEKLIPIVNPDVLLHRSIAQKLVPPIANFG